MNRDEFCAAIVAARPGRDDLLYIERRGDAYDWRVVRPGENSTDSAGPPAADPDVWMSFSAAWPVEQPEEMRAFLDDVLAELESMVGGADRCRWPLDDPWPHFH